MNRLSFVTGMAICSLAGSIQATEVSSRNNSFNPQISLILDGLYADYDNSPEDYDIAGFQLGGEAGLAPEGFAIGHSELTLGANIDRYFYGQSTFAIAEHEGATEVEIEEAYIQTLGLGHGSTIRFGRFLSSFGYHNTHHRHAWDFADAPLPYSAMLGGALADDGVQFTYIAPTELFMEINLELLAGNAFPAGGNEQGGIGASVLSVSFGGDLGVSHAWQLGLSHYRADGIGERSSGAHAHQDGTAEIPVFQGDSHINAIDLVYKWAPLGNTTERNLKIAMEVLQRSEQGDITLLNSGPPLESSSYRGDQSGWYVSAVYQFMPRWRSGIRHDQLHSDNTGSDATVLDEAGLSSPADDPRRDSIMLEWLPSEYSRLRLQFNDDRSTPLRDKQLLLQYTFSLGAHGAHLF